MPAMIFRETKNLTKLNPQNGLAAISSWACKKIKKIRALRSSCLHGFPDEMSA
jgi:hypothetical protein